MRGFVWRLYQTDDGNLFALLVDGDEAEQPERGWGVIADPVGINPLPRMWRPRRVVGIDEDGNKRRARIGSLDAALWTGEVSVFSIEGSDQLLHECAVIGREQEHTNRRPT